MTFQEIAERIQELSVEERKQLIGVIVDSLTETSEQPAKGKRIPGLHAGTMWVSDDFDDPLPDEFWLGDDK